MLFHTLSFLVFLSVIFSLYWLRPARTWQNVVTLAASILFYSWWDWRFCFLMLGTAFIDFAAGLLLERVDSNSARRLILATALGANLLILAFFKYYNFFLDSAVVALSTLGFDLQTSTLKIILPVGISFYTFQSMSYTIDIYRGHFVPERNPITYFSFVTFFPQLVAGPIERATALLPQFHQPRHFDPVLARWGLRLMLWGLAKKMLVADTLAVFVEQSFGHPAATPGAALALATLFFSLQIYCDFSAYSDIAAGAAALFGISLMRNFAYPYFSQTITEFWRRWHISLSTWFRDYVYLPLGGNKRSELLCYRNLFVVCLISGLWHGAAWTFVVWGALHGLYLVAERRLNRNKLAGISAGPPIPVTTGHALLRMLATFLLVAIAWVFFRAESVAEALLIFRRIFLEFGPFSGLPSLFAAQQSGILLALALLTIEWIGRKDWNPLKWQALPLPARWAGYTVLVWSLVLYGTGRIDEFIYFRF